MSDSELKSEGQVSKDSPVEIPDVLPLLPIRDIVIYPYMSVKPVMSVRRCGKANYRFPQPIAH